MWSEPLAASTSRDPKDERVRIVTLRDGAGRLVARVNYIVDVNSALGEVRVIDRTGTARQKVRAFGLMIRECVRGGRAEGVRHFIATIQPQMTKIARLATDWPGLVDDRGGMAMGRLEDLEARLAERVAADGRLLRATLADEADVAGRL